jgi:diguanylate cyclase (GGDEF)-like protein
MAVLMDFAEHALSYMPGLAINRILYIVLSLFLIAQNFAYYLIVVFLDYVAYVSRKRAKKFITAILVLMSLYTVVLLFNLRFGFFFHISAGNVYTPGPLYIVRLIISYLVVLLSILDMVFSSKHFKKSQVYLIAFFAILTGGGATLDIVLKSGSLTWTFFAATLLYIYFFIVQSDSKIDSLTGIGNRYSFNEFIDKLSKSNSKESWSIVMIDMDHFKNINDTFGHPEGDNALRDMAAIIKGCIRHSDYAFRYGGDEFIIAVKAEYNVETLMERIQNVIDSQNERHVRPYRLEMSYGNDVYTTNSEQQIKKLIANVDSLMYQNKKTKKPAEDTQLFPCP